MVAFTVHFNYFKCTKRSDEAIVALLSRTTYQNSSILKSTYFTFEQHHNDKIETVPQQHQPPLQSEVSKYLEVVHVSQGSRQGKTNYSGI